MTVSVYSRVRASLIITVILNSGELGGPPKEIGLELPLNLINQKGTYKPLALVS